jgi:hypothetical protein
VTEGERITSLPLLYHIPANDRHREKIVIQYNRRPFTGYDYYPRPSDIPPITEAQAEALDALHFLAEKHAIHLNFKKGDIQYANNLSIFHGRDGFKDTPNQRYVSNSLSIQSRLIVLASPDYN